MLRKGSISHHSRGVSETPWTQKGNPNMPNFHHATVANQPFSVERGISDILRSLLVADQLTPMSVIHPCDWAPQHSPKETHLEAPSGRSSTAPRPGHCSWHPSWHRESWLCSSLEQHNARMWCQWLPRSTDTTKGNPFSHSDQIPSLCSWLCSGGILCLCFVLKSLLFCKEAQVVFLLWMKDRGCIQQSQWHFTQPSWQCWLWTKY